MRRQGGVWTHEGRQAHGENRRDGHRARRGEACARFTPGTRSASCRRKRLPGAGTASTARRTSADLPEGASRMRAFREAGSPRNP